MNADEIHMFDVPDDLFHHSTNNDKTHCICPDNSRNSAMMIAKEIKISVLFQNEILSPTLCTVLTLMSNHIEIPASNHNKNKRNQSINEFIINENNCADPKRKIIENCIKKN